MTAQEFEEWKVMFREEQLHPGVARLRHAQVLAAVAQGAIVRRGGTMWTAADFLKAEPWAAPTSPAARRTAAQQIKAMTGRGRK